MIQKHWVKAFLLLSIGLFVYTMFFGGDPVDKEGGEETITEEEQELDTSTPERELTDLEQFFETDTAQQPSETENDVSYDEEVFPDGKPDLVF